jgi:uncharacterized cupredoxin-like copper-binding protein
VGSTKGIRLLTIGVAAVLSGACAGGPGSTGTPLTGESPGTAAPGDGEVQVTLQEWAVGTTPQSAPAGDVTFQVTNQGPEDEHEFVVIRTDLSLIDLPTDETGAVDEAGEGIEVIDEVEEIPVGESESLTVNLEPGPYVLICNIYDETEQEAHYQEGMRTSFDVN